MIAIPRLRLRFGRAPLGMTGVSRFAVPCSLFLFPVSHGRI